jgi:hypothetical protein
MFAPFNQEATVTQQVRNAAIEAEPRYYATHESAYHCPTCEVEGRDLDPEPVCWSCGGPAVVTSRPLVHTAGPLPDKSAVTPRRGPGSRRCTHDALAVSAAARS